MAIKFVYMFSEGDASMRNFLGGKGANLAEMTKLGMPIPQGFTITTEACNNYYDKGKVFDTNVIKGIEDGIKKLEVISNKKFGDKNDPLLVSVRSGSRISMPGMMDTVLNLGLNDVSVEGLANKTRNIKFAYDSYRRFIQMFADVVKEVNKEFFEEELIKMKELKYAASDMDLTGEDFKKLVSIFKKIYKEKTGTNFPQDPKEQLMESVAAVFRSWDNPRAIVYRRMHDIPSLWGTAVNVQMMVFGNMGDTCGTGVAFTRNPSTGENFIFGEYLINAQGEDVVAGIRTPNPIAVLERDMPEVYKEFMNITSKLENHYKDMQDVEFTIENKKLYFLQTRNGKRTAQAALKIAVDLVAEGMINKEEAIMKVDPKQLDQLLHPVFDVKALDNITPIVKGLPASPGAAAGQVYFTAETAKEAKNKRGERVILVRQETSPEDIEGIVAARGILTVRGGMTSHAAVVARGMGTCCIVGCSDIIINEKEQYFTIDEYTVNEGDFISLDGTTGKVYIDDIKTVSPKISGDFATLMDWADKIRTLKVRANADTPKDAIKALEFGAEGIGLTRTEHMFFNDTRIMSVRKMILAETKEVRRAALNELLPMQKKDFICIYKTMEDKPVTIRLLDPPLHEFLPRDEKSIIKIAKEMNITVKKLKEKIESLHEFNPMMGHRGCRLVVTFPEIAEMQCEAIIEAALEVKKTKGFNIIPEIMVPLAGEIAEFKYVKEVITNVADTLIKRSGIELDYMVGTMIEIPRAALLADKIAKEAEFFSFGTNDLTQMTFGFSRDDAGGFLDDYYAKRIYEFDPFVKLDQDGVGQLVKMAVEKGKFSRSNIKLGICGEHGGDPSSIDFCYRVGLHYVSCSPFRVPIARLAAAQSVLINK